MVSKAQRRINMDQALANTAIEGHVPTQEFLADAQAVVEGTLTTEQAIQAAAARAVVAKRKTPPAPQKEPATARAQ